MANGHIQAHANSHPKSPSHNMGANCLGTGKTGWVGQWAGVRDRLDCAVSSRVQAQHGLMQAFFCLGTRKRRRFGVGRASDRSLLLVIVFCGVGNSARTSTHLKPAYRATFSVHDLKM